MQKLIPNSLASSCTSRKRSFTSDTGKLPFYIGHVENGKSAFPSRLFTAFSQTKPNFTEEHLSNLWTEPENFLSVFLDDHRFYHLPWALVVWPGLMAQNTWLFPDPGCSTRAQLILRGSNEMLCSGETERDSDLFCTSTRTVAPTQGSMTDSFSVSSILHG